MDRIKEAATTLIKVNQYRKGELQDHELIKSICTYFDTIKDQEVNEADLKFLKYLSNIIGIPHFYDVLEKFKRPVSIENLDLQTFSSYITECTLHTSKKNKVHRYQKQILDKFSPSLPNRFFLSASTSFGKTHLVFEIIKKIEYNNVILIFPTIALLSENLERITSEKAYIYFRENYSIHTLSEVNSFGAKNIFIYTPERYLSFIEKNYADIEFDFCFIDEVYKIDNEYELDDDIKEHERDVAYRLAAYYALKDRQVDVLLAGPYIDFSNPNDNNYNDSFDNFLTKNDITLIDYNQYEIVNKYYYDIQNKTDKDVDNHLNFNFKSKDKNKMLLEIISSVSNINENVIIYCPLKRQVESYAKKIYNSGILNNHDYSEYINFINHLASNFTDEWTLIKALKAGVGIHHGLVPKYIQKEIINLFNKKQLQVLISTTTITEGVNTSAKNLIVLDSMKGDKPLKKFDAKNIAGRAGRFLHHYSGRVFALQNNFLSVIESKGGGIKHKNFDIESPKNDIDLYHTNDEYLNTNDNERISKNLIEQKQRNIPDFIFEYYKVVSRVDKITVYDEIKRLSPSQLGAIRMLIRRINFNMDIDNDGFQVILNVILPIVKNDKLKFLITQMDKNNRYSVLTHLVHFYLADGFMSSMKYKLNQGKSIDSAIKETADFVYNTLKYQVVKYLGVFNLMYKLHLSSEKTPFEVTTGIDMLIVKLEYNAISNNGRIASDYGVPAKIVEYYENDNDERIRRKFDTYEMSIFNKIEKIMKSNN